MENRIKMGQVIYMNIEELLDLLDWNLPDEVQKAGIISASEENIEVFLQPNTKRHNKNVWQNCAVVLSQKTDDQLRPHLHALFSWISDMNWPGAFEIWDRLKNFKDNAVLTEEWVKAMQKAQATKREDWVIILMQFAKENGLTIGYSI